MKLSVPLRIAFNVVVAAAALWAATSKRLYDIAAFNALVSMGLTAVIVLHLRLKPSWSDAAGVAAGAGTLALIDFKLLHYNFNAFGLLSFLGLASLVALAIRAAWSRGEESARMRLAFTFAFLSLSVDAAAVLFHALTSKLNPRVLDLYLYSFDASLRVQLSFLMGQAYATWHRFGDAGMFVYIGLPVVLAMVAAGRLLHGSKAAIPAMAAFLVTAPIGVVFYNLFPRWARRTFSTHDSRGIHSPSTKQGACAWSLSWWQATVTRCHPCTLPGFSWLGGFREGFPYGSDPLPWFLWCSRHSRR
jgi:hypothetical protein